MKKTFAFLLTFVLLASLGASAFAAIDTSLYSEDRGGARLKLPEDFQNLSGVLSIMSDQFDPYTDVYITSVNYTAMTEEEMAAWQEAMSKKDITDEELDRLSEQNEQAAAMPLAVVAAGSEDLADFYQQSLINKGYHPTRTKLGEADGYLFYLYDTSVDDEEKVSHWNSAFAEEYRRVYAGVLDVINRAEFFAPVVKDPNLGVKVSFETTDLDGNPVKSEDIFSRNDITMLNVWATWCNPCVEELEELGRIDQRLRDINCGIVGILFDGHEPGALEEGKAILDKNHVEYLNLLPPKDFESMVTIEHYPTSLMIDSNGVVQYTFTGAYVDAYEDIINSLLKGEKPNLLREPAPIAASNAESYRVIVLDNDGKPVEGATVQFCSTDSCILGKTDSEGAAVFEMPGGEVYTVHILKVPEGFEKNKQEYETRDVPSDLTVTINKAA